MFASSLLAIAKNGFFGTIVSTTDIKGVVTALLAFCASATLVVASVAYRCSIAAAVAGSIRSPGLIVLASVMPMTAEIRSEERRVGKRLKHPWAALRVIQH